MALLLPSSVAGGLSSTGARYGGGRGRESAPVALLLPSSGAGVPPSPGVRRGGARMKGAPRGGGGAAVARLVLL